jgi:hypothetical protein
MSDLLEWRWEWLPTEEEEQSGPLVNGFTFWQGLYHAAETSGPTHLGDTDPLTTFMSDPQARATISENGWHAFLYFLAEHGKQRSAGNPLQSQLLDSLVYEAARRVYLGKADWREREGKQRVPKDVVNDLIKGAIRWIARRRDVVIPENSGEHANLERRIRTLLKNQVFLAHSNS